MNREIRPDVGPRPWIFTEYVEDQEKRTHSGAVLQVGLDVTKEYYPLLVKHQARNSQVSHILEPMLAVSLHMNVKQRICLDTRATELSHINLSIALLTRLLIRADSASSKGFTIED
ncbi:hypothetical protein Vi05172_g3753 [Venturia inaequalis]|nr:hypothetical protein Vi05172_g3753 [Venturia inaequalis]